MENYLPTIVSVIEFTLVSILFIIILSIILNLLSKKFDIDKLRLYGIFHNMTRNTNIAFCLVTLTYILLVWLLVDQNISYVFIAAPISMTILADLLTDNYPNGFVNLINVLASLLSIYIIQQIEISKQLYIIIILINIFLFFYFTYMTFNNLNNLIAKEKTRILKNKRSNANENR